MELNQTEQTEFTVVSNGTRFANFIIDRIILTIIVFGFGLLLGLVLFATDNESILNGPLFRIIDFIIGLLLYVVYYIIMEANFGTTIGKMITGTVVVSEDGSKPSTSQIVRRSFCRIIPFEPFSFFGSDDGGWHDTMSETKVVLKSETKNRASKDHLLDDWE